MAINYMRFQRSDRRVVLIGSMGVYADMLRIAEELNQRGIQTVVPDPDNNEYDRLPLHEYEEFKRRTSFAYIRKIRDPRTFCVLAVNLDRHGILNYIGPNTFAEIAVAFAQSKRIYLYQGIPDPYLDELSAWRCVLLNCNLDSLIEDYQQNCMVNDFQLKLFE